MATNTCLPTVRAPVDTCQRVPTTPSTPSSVTARRAVAGWHFGESPVVIPGARRAGTLCLSGRPADARRRVRSVRQCAGAALLVGELLRFRDHGTDHRRDDGDDPPHLQGHQVDAADAAAAAPTQSHTNAPQGRSREDE